MQTSINRNEWGATGEIQITWVLPRGIDYVSKKIQNI